MGNLKGKLGPHIFQRLTSEGYQKSPGFSTSSENLRFFSLRSVKENHVPQDVKFFYPFRPEIQAGNPSKGSQNKCESFNDQWIDVHDYTPEVYTPQV